MKIRLSELRSIIREVLEDDVEEEIDEMMASPEYGDIDSFVEYKFDNDEAVYNFMELQAVARNLTQEKLGKPVTVAAKGDIDLVKSAAESYGLKFVGREPIRRVRGVTSSAHGTSPFVGMHGGTGMGGFGGSDGIGMGGGPGAMGSGKKWERSSAPRTVRSGVKGR